MPENSARPNPYVGPRAFQTGEKLYGRDHELRDLLDLLIAERVVLLYSPSGAGKSSLIHAGLIPQLQEQGFHVLPVIRVNQEVPAAVQPRQKDEPANPASRQVNRYLFSTLLSLEEEFPEQQQIDVDELAALDLIGYLQKRASQKDEKGGAEQLSEMLIFDQFEEVLTLDPTDQDGKADFFAQVGAVLRDRNRWALFALREDYVGALDPYIRPIPTRLNNRFRLDLLGTEAAQQAIRQPARDSGVDYVQSAVTKLVNDLRQVQVQRADGTLEDQLGPYVEPVQLQVVCFRLWQHLSSDKKEITEEDLASMGDVNQSLQEYYSESIADVSRESGVSERLIRDWFEHHLITEQGIRGQVLMAPEKSEGLDNSAIRLLEDAHLVRAEKRRGATWFELAHDRLIRPVRNSNDAWYQANLSLLQRQAALWEKNEHPDHLLLRDSALEQAQAWATAHAEELSQVDQEFLSACQEAHQHELEKLALQQQAVKIEEQSRSAHKLRQRLVFASLALVAAIVFAASAFYTGNLARLERDRNAGLASTAQSAGALALENYGTAQANAATADAAKATAINDRAAAVESQRAALSSAQDADVQRLAAEDARATAQANFGEAQRQASLATSRQLAALALGYQDSQPELASLLGNEAYRISQTREARNVLLERLQNAIRLTATEVRPSIPSEKNDIRKVVFSPDGEHMAWSTFDGWVVLWNIPQFKEEFRIQHQNNVNALTFSPDGKLLASGSDDAAIFLTDIATRKTDKLEGVVNTVQSLSFSPDGERLAAAVGTQITIWDLASKQVIRSLPRESFLIQSVAWSPDGKMLASGRRILTVWNTEDWSIVRRLSGHREGVLDLAWAPDNKLLASSSADNTVILWDLATGQPKIPPLKLHGDRQVNSVAISPDGKVLASGGDDRSVMLFDLEKMKPITRIEDDFLNGVTSVAFKPNTGDYRLAAGSLDNSITVFDINVVQPLSQDITSGKGEVISLVELPDGTLLLAGRRVNGLDIWRVNASQEEKTTLPYIPTAAAFSPDGKLLALGEKDGDVRLLDAANGHELAAFSNSKDSILSLAFSPDGKSLASSQCAEFTGGDDTLSNLTCVRHDILVWDIASGTVQNSLDVDESAAYVQTSLTGHRGTVRALAFNPSGTLLATGSEDLTIQLWDLATGQPVGIPLAGNTAAITSLAFSPDGASLASGSADRVLTLWDLSSNQAVGKPLAGSPGVILSLSYDTQESGILFSGDDSGNVLQWDVDPDSWAARNCSLAERNLTQAEWRQLISGQPYHVTCEQFPPGE